MSLKIIGTGAGIPNRCVSNDDLALFLDTSDDWIFSRTGIKNRHVCTTETLTDLSVSAAGSALEKAGVTPGDLDLIICSTISGDYVTPSLACCVSEQMGARCPAFDINVGCTGFIYALDIASLYLSHNRAKHILIVCAEMMTTKADWTDRSTCVLFGDGAAACVVTGGTALKYINLAATADSKTLCLPANTGNSPFIANKREAGFLHMDGQEVFKFAVHAVETEIEKAFEALALSSTDIDYFILHQANKRIIDFARARLKQPEEKFPTNIDRYGNMSSTTVLLLLHEMLEAGEIKPGQTLFMTAFGSGLTAGSCVMVWE